MDQIESYNLFIEYNNYNDLLKLLTTISNIATDIYDQQILTENKPINKYIKDLWYVVKLTLDNIAYFVINNNISYYYVKNIYKNIISIYEYASLMNNNIDDNYTNYHFSNKQLKKTFDNIKQLKNSITDIIVHFGNKKIQEIFDSQFINNKEYINNFLQVIQNIGLSNDDLAILIFNQFAKENAKELQVSFDNDLYRYKLPDNDPNILFIRTGTLYYDSDKNILHGSYYDDIHYVEWTIDCFTLDLKFN